MTQYTADLESVGYPNPLDNFRTYSYNFIITAASSSEAIRSLIGKDENGLAPVLSKVQDIGLGDKIEMDGSSAYLVLDTRRFSQYSITELNLTHVPGTGDQINPQLILTAGHFKLQDSTGITFYNFLMDLFADKLKASAPATVFLMTVLFSGHHYDGTVEHVVTTNIPFQIKTIGFEFTSSGTLFDIDILLHEGLEAGGRTIPSDQMSSMGAIKSVSTKGRDKTIGGMMDSLEAQLNEQSLDYFLKYNGVSSEQVSSIKPGKLVQYMITVPPQWRAMIPNMASTARNTEKRYSRRGGPMQVSKTIDDFELSFALSTPIDKAISKILETSTEFAKESSTAKRIAGEGMQFRISPVITSDDTTYTIHYDVYPHAMPKPKQIEDGKINYLHYDYLFTGKNSHIKDLRITFNGASAMASIDKKMLIGRNRFAVNASSGQKISDVKKDSTATNDKPNPQEIDRKNILANDPIYMGVISKQQLDNNADHRDENVESKEAADAFDAKQEYRQAVAYLNYQNSLHLSMTIRGNPNLMQKLADINTTGGMPPHSSIVSSTDLTALLKEVDVNNTGATATAIKNGVASAKQKYIDTYVTKRIDGLDQVMKPHYQGDSFDPLNNGADTSVIGLFAKINIRAPNVDYVGNFTSGEPLYTDSFFYQGLYRVNTVETTLSHGDFTQTLHMFAYDIVTPPTAQK